MMSERVDPQILISFSESLSLRGRVDPQIFGVDEVPQRIEAVPFEGPMARLVLVSAEFSQLFLAVAAPAKERLKAGGRGGGGG